MSSNVVTFCFFGDVTLICELVDGEFSIANVDSRSSMSKENSPGISPHTVVGNVGVLSLFQKKRKSTQQRKTPRKNKRKTWKALRPTKS